MSALILFAPPFPLPFERALYAVDVFKSNIQSYPIQLMYQDAKLRNTSCIPRDFLQLRNSFSSDAVVEHRSKGGTQG